MRPHPGVPGRFLSRGEECAMARPVLCGLRPVRPGGLSLARVVLPLGGLLFLLGALCARAQYPPQNPHEDVWTAAQPICAMLGVSGSGPIRPGAAVLLTRSYYGDW